jgi:hypothetical protein
VTPVAHRWDFSERLSPLVVKELRQGLRGTLFAVAFGLVLFACLAVVLEAAVSQAGAGSSSAGRSVFATLLMVQAVACFFVIPFAAFRSMAREVEAETWVLLALTGLGARSIVRSKWSSAMGQVALFSSACTPFILFSYFLNGVDLLQLGAAVLITVCWSALSCAAGVALGTEGRSRPGRAVAQLGAIAALLAGTAVGVFIGGGLAREGWRLASLPSARLALIVGCVLAAALTALVLEAGASALSLPSDEPSRVRKLLCGVTLSGLFVGGVLFVLEGGNRDDAAAAQLFTSFLLTLTGAFIVAQPDGAPGHWRKGRGAGPWRGFLLVLGLLAASALCWAALLVWREGFPLEGVGVRRLRLIIAALLYPALFLSLGILIGRLTPLRRAGEPLATRVGFVGSVVLSTAAALPLSVLMARHEGYHPVQALSALTGLIYFLERGDERATSVLVLLGAVTLLYVFLAAVVLRERDREAAP